MLPNKVRDTVIIGVTILLVFAFILWFVSPAQAQMCSNFKEGAAKLKKDYGESPLDAGGDGSIRVDMNMKEDKKVEQKW